MPQPLRSTEFPRGLANLSEKDSEKLRIYNKLGHFAAELQKIALRMNIPGGEENPASSFLWLQRSRQWMQRQEQCSSYIIDYCAFGTPWRARTRLHVWHAPEELPLHERRCKGRGICQYSGVEHVVLSGAKSGQFLTKKTPLPCA